MALRRLSLLLTASMLALLLLAAGCGSSGSSSSGGVQHIVLWHGYTDQEAKALNAAVKEWNRTHKNIQVTAQFYGNSDYALQKVLTAIAGGKPPDISYLYGSWAANIAKNPKVVDISKLMQSTPGFDWNDFWPAERKAATVNGKVVGVPALVDNLALVYNKKLLRAAGVPFPTPDWTWNDLRSAAKKLTDPSTKQFGWAYIADGGEDTVWRFEALLWQAGGEILDSSGTKAAFDSDAGVHALTLLQQMATQDHSIYLDSGNDNYSNLFNSGKIAMLYTGPWDLAGFPNVDFGVQILPGDKNHQTISGPDNWVMFDNGEARTQAAWKFLSWLTSAKTAIHMSLTDGHLPIRRSETQLPDYQTFVKKFPGVATFVANEQNALQARPVTDKYPKISAAIGQAVQAVLLGKAQPKQALDSAAQQVDGILAAP
jgi:multiple sugar transport system substrate-binding protein